MIIHEGPSQVDGRPVAVVATGYKDLSDNSKTGPMVQCWIVPRDVHPVEATRTGRDCSVCGNCPLRPSANAKLRCYVNMRPLIPIGKKLLADTYPWGTLRDVLRRAYPWQSIRVGAWGDPCAVPFDVWAPLLESGRKWTGYTHCWGNVPADPWASLLMASVESPEGAQQAQAMGWCTFRIRRLVDGCPEPLLPGEIQCPAAAESGHRTTCGQCGLCNGIQGRRRSIAIVDHGPNSRRNQEWTPSSSASTASVGTPSPSQS